MFSWKVKTHLEVGGRFRVSAAAGRLVEEITEDIEEEKYGEQVQEGEEALVIVEGGVVSDHLWGEEREADDDQEERIEEWAGDEQTRSEKYLWSNRENLCLPLSVSAMTYFCPPRPHSHSSPTSSILSWLELRVEEKHCPKQLFAGN